MKKGNEVYLTLVLIVPTTWCSHIVLTNYLKNIGSRPLSGRLIPKSLVNSFKNHFLKLLESKNGVCLSPVLFLFSKISQSLSTMVPKPYLQFPSVSWGWISCRSGVLNILIELVFSYHYSSVLGLQFPLNHNLKPF